MTETTTRIYDLDEIARILRDEWEIPAYVEQTGGGCATIYAGEPFESREVVAIVNGEKITEDVTRIPCLAGPGWFDGPNWTKGRADGGDFYIGPDDDGGDEFDPVEFEHSRVKPDEDEADVARRIAALVEASPRGRHDAALRRFRVAMTDFLAAGDRLIEFWDADHFNADIEFPLPARIAPPLSLDEWFDELRAVYLEEGDPR